MTTRSRIALVASLVALAACDDTGIDPITKIDGPRVLAITTEPSAIPLDGDVELTVWAVDPGGPRLGIGASAPSVERPLDAVRVRACAPWKFITEPARDCVGPDALPLAHDDAGRIVTSAAMLAAAFPSPAGVPAPADPWRAALGAGLGLRVPIIAEVEVDGRTLIARRDLAVVETAMERKNPHVVELRFDGVSTRTLRAGQRYTMTATLDRASLDASPTTLATAELEKAVANFYSPSGELSEPEAEFEQHDAPVLESAPIEYLAGAPGRTWLFVVATDETDGMSATAVPLAIE